MRLSINAIAVLVFVCRVTALIAGEVIVYQRLGWHVPKMRLVESMIARSATSCVIQCVVDHRCFGVAVAGLERNLSWQCHLNLYPFSKSTSKPASYNGKNIMRLFAKKNSPMNDTWTKSTEDVAVTGALVPGTSCDDHAVIGATTTGVYFLSLLGTMMAVYCEFEKTAQVLVVWTHLQRRFDGSVDFYRNWEQYKQGFGPVSGEFWLGNEAIYELTKAGDQEVRFVMGYEGQTSYADYSTFQVANEVQKYQLSIAGYSGAAGDSMSIMNNQKFTTFDADNDNLVSGNCAVKHGCSWWISQCYHACFNGNYTPGPLVAADAGNGITWYGWLGQRLSMESSDIKIKTKQ